MGVLHRPTRELRATSPGAIAERYRTALAAVVGECEDVDELAATVGVDPETLDALDSGDAPTVTVDAAARVLGTADRWPDAPAIAAGAREKLLVGTVTGVVDAADVATDTGLDLTAEGARRRLTGAEATTLAEFAAIEAYLADEAE